jgi:FAD/FMN-containing dehydrogenase
MIDYEEDETSPTSTLYVAIDGATAVAEAIAARLAAIALGTRAEPLPAEQVERFWRTRHDSAMEYAQQLAEHQTRLLDDDAPPRPRRRGWRYMHVALPAGQVLPFRARAQALAAARRVKLHSAGIWGAPELFSFVLEGPPKRTDDVADEILGQVAVLGGSIEYCHGAGLRLAHLMPRALGPAMPILRRIKSALDPGGLLNQGKQGLGSV